MSLTELLKPLGPGARIVYLQLEDNGQWWCEITLPIDRYSVTLTTEFGGDADDAVRNTVARGMEFRRDAEQGRAA